MLGVWYKLFEEWKHSTDIDTARNTFIFNSDPDINIAWNLNIYNPEQLSQSLCID